MAQQRQMIGRFVEQVEQRAVLRIAFGPLLQNSLLLGGDATVEAGFQYILNLCFETHGYTSDGQTVRHTRRLPTISIEMTKKIGN